MKCMLEYVLVICFGLRGVVAAHSDGYIGCYTFMSSDHNTYFSNNSGPICKAFCFPQYRYAATRLLYCFCMERLNGEQKQKCHFECPDQIIAGESCGGLQGMTVFDAQKTSTTYFTTATSTTTSAMLNTSTTQSVRSTVTSPTVNTKSTINQVVTTDETTANSTTSTSLETMSLTGFLINCVVVAECLVIINIVVLCVCKKNRQSKQGHEVQIDNYGYISPANVTELDDTTPHNNFLQMRNEVTTNIAVTSSNMYEYLNRNVAECQYSDLV